ncbi:potassium voltage-gated channel subfamily A member 2 [Hydra vulgaris]|uniref:Potassium voltage-gated channel subfamily A member 2 n=1 Tax=Hydra vulgaris TaxID=6087 RepID=A0ABM4CNW3_HYDVU
MNKAISSSLPIFSTKSNMGLSNLLCHSRNCEALSKFSLKPEENVIVINVSGKRYETFLTTIERFPNTLLGNPEKRKHFYNLVKHEYFFDRHRRAFSGILNYYQSNGLLEKPEEVSEKIFTQELIFFELVETKQHCEDYNSSVFQEELHLPSNPILKTIWVMFKYPKSSRLAQFLAIFSLTIILLSIVVFCIQTIPFLNPDNKEGEHMKTTWLVINSICNSWFTLEYLLRFLAAPDRLYFVRSILNIVDLVSIIPFYLEFAFDSKSSANYIICLKVIRILCVIRVFKLFRHARGLHLLANTIKESFEELLMLVMFLAIGAILFASAAYFAEGKINSDFQSIPHSLWWAVVTMTTIGYGDVVPVTLAGKMIGMFCSISGVLVVAIPIPVIVSNFEYFYKEERNRRTRQKELSKRLNLTKKIPSL